MVVFDLLSAPSFIFKFIVLDELKSCGEKPSGHIFAELAEHQWGVFSITVV